ncbi:hypothetical protein [Terasakiella pusilla]|uniref:hypothetical protein n=1 Tax=Terasakiella pusilla TaxID=64973 RepID=UPI003AA80A3B
MAFRLGEKIETNNLDEYTFVGHSGQRVIDHADKLLNMILRHELGGPDVASLFAIPRFDDNRRHISWFSHHTGAHQPFWEQPDDIQQDVLLKLKSTYQSIKAIEEHIKASSDPNVMAYARMLPLLLNFPEPVEYHLFLKNNQPTCTHWGANKSIATSSQDTLGPFLESWQERLNHKRRMEQEAAENAKRAETFMGRLTRAGAKIGNITVSLVWNDINDLDLHIACPNGETINFTNKFACGGMLDIDRNAQANSLVADPVENIVWTRSPTVKGTYEVYVHYYRRFDGKSAPSTFDVRLQKAGKTTFHNGQLKENETQHVVSFSI